MTDTFKDQNFGERMKGMGDLAESRCEAALEANKRGFVRLGLDRPPIAVWMLPARLRHLPDFLTSKTFIECKGFGRDQIMKLKLEDFGCLNWWNDLHPVEMFVFDSHHDRQAFVPWDVARNWPADGRVALGSFPEGKPFFSIPAEVVFDGI